MTSGFIASPRLALGRGPSCGGVSRSGALGAPRRWEAGHWPHCGSDVTRPGRPGLQTTISHSSSASPGSRPERRNGYARRQPSSPARRSRPTTHSARLPGLRYPKSPLRRIFMTEDGRGYFRLLRRLLNRFSAFRQFLRDRHSLFVRNEDHWSVEEQFAGRGQPTQFGRAQDQPGITQMPRMPRTPPEHASGCLTSELRLTETNDLVTSYQVMSHFFTVHSRRFSRAPLLTETAWGSSLHNVTTSVASTTDARLAMTILCIGTGAVFRSRRSPRCMNLSKERPRSITQISVSISSAEKLTQPGDIFTLLLHRPSCDFVSSTVRRCRTIAK